MKRILCAVLLLLVPLFGGCESKEKKEEKHNQLIQEIGDQNKKKQENRQAFLNAKVHGAAEEYLASVFEELAPGCEYEISLEPGEYKVNETTAEAVPSTPEEWKKFFSDTELWFSLAFWNSELEPEQLCQDLMARGISGRMAADEYRQDEWILDAVSGKAEFYRKPGV